MLLPAERNVAQLFDTEKQDTESIKQTALDQYLKGTYDIPKSGALLALSS